MGKLDRKAWQFATASGTHLYLEFTTPPPTFAKWKSLTAIIIPQQFFADNSMPSASLSQKAWVLGPAWVVMGTGNSGVFPEWPGPRPLNTPTLGRGRGFSRVWVRVSWGFKGRKPLEGCSMGRYKFWTWKPVHSSYVQYKFKDSLFSKKSDDKWRR